MTIIDRIKAHPAVESISDERFGRNNDGFWAYLKYGWHLDNPGEHAIHEDGPREVLRELKYLKPCPCKECLDHAAKVAAAETN